MAQYWPQNRLEIPFVKVACNIFENGTKKYPRPYCKLCLSKLDQKVGPLYRPENRVESIELAPNRCALPHHFIERIGPPPDRLRKRCSSMTDVEKLPGCGNINNGKSARWKGERKLQLIQFLANNSLSLSRSLIWVQVFKPTSLHKGVNITEQRVSLGLKSKILPWIPCRVSRIGEISEIILVAFGELSLGQQVPLNSFRLSRPRGAVACPPIPQCHFLSTGLSENSTKSLEIGNKFEEPCTICTLQKWVARGSFRHRNVITGATMDVILFPRSG